jgi:hypothetical protein
MASLTSFASGCTQRELTVGWQNWVNPTGFTFDDTSFAHMSISSGLSPFNKLSELTLSLAGTPSGNSIITGSGITVDGNGDSVLSSLSLTDTYMCSIGGQSELWGLSLTPSDINNSGFGIALTLKAGVLTDWTYASTLKTSNYGFNVPTNATITGVQIELKGKYTTNRGDITVYLNCARVTVYYTEGGGTSGTLKYIGGFATASISKFGSFTLSEIKSIGGETL